MVTPIVLIKLFERFVNINFNRTKFKIDGMNNLITIKINKQPANVAPSMMGHHLNTILSRPLHTHERPNPHKMPTKKSGRKLLQPSDKETKPEKSVNAVQHLSNQQKNSVMESNGRMAPAPVVQVHKIC